MLCLSHVCVYKNNYVLRVPVQVCCRGSRRFGSITMAKRTESWQRYDISVVVVIMYKDDDCTACTCNY